MVNETMLLLSLLAAIHKADPDIIVGHDFLGVSLDVLLHRMRDLKIKHWSRIGCLRRAKWSSIGKQGTNLKFLNGRLMCDLTSDGAKSMIASTTWSLTEMCKTHLKSDRQDIDPSDTANYFDGSLSTPKKLITFVRYCELDAHYQMAIATKVQIVPLTKQLTNLAGNSWNKTLNGGCAERNEYILLHKFHRLKYICPDKSRGMSKNVSQFCPARQSKLLLNKSMSTLLPSGRMFALARSSWTTSSFISASGKNPEDYPKTRGGNARAGDVVPYVFCLLEGEETVKTAQADRARHRDELRKADSDHKIDYDYYLSQQILPPTERLCEPIEGTDRPRLAECLGLDPNRYRSTMSTSAEERAFLSMVSQLSDAQQYKDADPFLV
ncbi:dna polymerase alpha catalytic subunit [Moniliophthora roreri MCA 2997]|uniref:DNA-directed DNA polymerase n=1 Tax=Moniliophthora roreri (strain MCA 2997) TaxID=1381753 RepID=V2WIU3_MONRO|nr:dna polymerase alpha catalytic subunit [Moniliophthora roreri MCA 2997]